jgi:hypothetical protein
MPTLCAPTPDVTCFGCCPPIRPAHYDPLDYVSSLRREFRDNRQHFLREGLRHRPIVGYSCWALGYLDATGRRIGCLLHPLRHQGRDLRSAIDYGDKCERESCLAARIFARLSPAGQRFWLSLADGLNSFYYSSRRGNPLFHLLLWGPTVLEQLREEAQQVGWSVSELLWQQPFLLEPGWSPRGQRYLLRLMLTTGKWSLPTTESALAITCRRLWEAIRSLPEAAKQDCPTATTCFVHQLPLEEDFLDFLRTGLGWQRATWTRARALQHRVAELCAPAA